LQPRDPIQPGSPRRNVGRTKLGWGTSKLEVTKKTPKKLGNPPTWPKGEQKRNVGWPGTTTTGQLTLGFRGCSPLEKITTREMHVGEYGRKKKNLGKTEVRGTEN